MIRALLLLLIATAGFAHEVQVEDVYIPHDNPYRVCFVFEDGDTLCNSFASKDEARRYYDAQRVGLMEEEHDD